MFLLDANILINAARDYYALDQVPEFWTWLIYKAECNEVKIPSEIIAEVLVGNKRATEDQLLTWLDDSVRRNILTLAEEVDPKQFQKVMGQGYGEDLTEIECGAMGRDPFLIAYAMVHCKDRCVVTAENRAPKRKRHQRKVPDVCDTLGVRHCTVFQMTRELGFKTGWKV